MGWLIGGWVLTVWGAWMIIARTIANFERGFRLGPEAVGVVVFGVMVFLGVQLILRGQRQRARDPHQ